MNTLVLGKCLLVSSLLFAVYSTHAEPSLSGADLSVQRLTLQEAIQLATQNQPLLGSFDNAAAAAREAAVAESQLPDPRLSFGIQNLPVTNSDALHFDRDDMTMATLGVTQEVVAQAKREASSHILQAEAEQYQAEKQVTARTIQRDVALAWLNAFEAQRKAELYVRLSDDMAAERKVALASVSAGATPAAEVLRLDSELAMTRDKSLMAQADEKKARAALARWLGADAARPVADTLPHIGMVALNGTAAIENHPLLASSRQAENVAVSAVERAKTERLQNWSWEVMYGKRRSDLSDMLTVQVAIDLPWDRANRQDRRTAEKLLLVEKARQQIEDQRRQLQAQLASAQADWDVAEARETEHQQRLIPAAEARLELAQAGYVSGKQPLAALWQARSNLLEVELQHWAILTDRQRAAVELDYLLANQQLLERSPS
jgi:cobalt-zinc-cadmium efflux system outer membrane protein